MRQCTICSHKHDYSPSMMPEKDSVTIKKIIKKNLQSLELTFCFSFFSLNVKFICFLFSNLIKCTCFFFFGVQEICALSIFSFVMNISCV